MNLKKEILGLIYKSGFTKAGFSYFGELDNRHSAHFSNWLGISSEKPTKSASMDWMNRTAEKRKNISMVFPEGKTVISLAFLYRTDIAYSEDTVKISKYALGDDYHIVLKEKLKLLCNNINNLEEGIKTLYYTDDGPIMEKYWAVKSGLGWQGKNTLVINPEFGSDFFLSEILINRELTPDLPYPDLCGNCKLCVSSCPADALETPYVLDANKCIAYHNIENKNEIPPETDFHGWAFGCDICSDVCPYNQINVFTSEKSFFPNLNIHNKKKSELTKLVNSDETFKIIFKNSPIKRRKYSGWLKNLDKI